MHPFQWKLSQKSFSFEHAGVSHEGRLQELLHTAWGEQGKSVFSCGSLLPKLHGNPAAEAVCSAGSKGMQGVPAVICVQ